MENITSFQADAAILESSVIAACEAFQNYCGAKLIGDFEAVNDAIDGQYDAIANVCAVLHMDAETGYLSVLTAIETFTGPMAQVIEIARAYYGE